MGCPKRCSRTGLVLRGGDGRHAHEERVAAQLLPDVGSGDGPEHRAVAQNRARHDDRRDPKHNLRTISTLKSKHSEAATGSLRLAL